jgi:hypothetical protein
MAQLRWQKPADGSDTLAMAQIRWQRVLTDAPDVDRRFALNVRLAGFSFLILIARFATLEA